MKYTQKLITLLMFTFVMFAIIESRPSGGDNNQEVDVMDQSDLDEIRGTYYDLPTVPLYNNIPLQMLLARYRPTSLYRTPSYNTMNELFRLPESKRQVRYRQCYFNPISCFKK